MELEELHDCEKCHGKIVSISVDKLGVTRCGYCGAVVDYKKWMDEQMGSMKKWEESTIRKQ